jgi:hypothetical protein
MTAQLEMPHQARQRVSLLAHRNGGRSGLFDQCGILLCQK